MMAAQRRNAKPTVRTAFIWKAQRRVVRLLHMLPQIAIPGPVVISVAVGAVIAVVAAVGEEIRFSPSEERIEIIGPSGMAPAKSLERSGYFSGRFLYR
jgi:hypothetical protein